MLAGKLDFDSHRFAARTLEADRRFTLQLSGFFVSPGRHRHGLFAGWTLQVLPRVLRCRLQLFATTAPELDLGAEGRTTIRSRLLWARDRQDNMASRAFSPRPLEFIRYLKNLAARALECDHLCALWSPANAYS